MSPTNFLYHRDMQSKCANSFVEKKNLKKFLGDTKTIIALLYRGSKDGWTS